MENRVKRNLIKQKSVLHAYIGTPATCVLYFQNHKQTDDTCCFQSVH